MTKASDNPFPSILVAEQGSKPSTPASGYGRIYAKSDGLYFIGDNGTEVGPFGTSGSGSGETTSLLLNYAASTDLFNATSISNGSWVNVIANQNFTVTDATKLVMVTVAGSIRIGNSTTDALGSVRIVIDSDGTPIYKNLGFSQSKPSTYSNILSGNNLIFFSGVSAATHTIKLQMYSSGGTNNIIYCRCSTVPEQEFLYIQIAQCP